MRKDEGCRAKEHSPFKSHAVVVCPGMHEPELTDEFLTGMGTAIAVNEQWLVFPGDRHPVYSGLHVAQFLHERLSANGLENGLKCPIALIGFSAGVVGAIAAAHLWQAWGGSIQTVIALDGWGTPLGGNFPIHRLSHDYFTHWSSALLGAGQDSFYADPGVGHLDLWRSPQTAQGYYFSSPAQTPSRTNAADVIATLLERYSLRR